jgi:hypothetical protein
MQYTINSVDLKTTYGIDIKNGVNAFLAMPDRKASVQHDFPEENGIDIDLTEPTFSARTFTFNCIQSSSTVADLQTKYWALFNLLKIAGSYAIYNDFLAATLQVYYQKQANLSNIQKNSQGGYSITYDLIFGESDPFAQNIPNVFLVDDQNRFLVP